MILSLLALLATTATPEAPERAVVRSRRPAVVEMRTAALILSGQQGGALEVAVAALPGAGPSAVTGDEGAGVQDSTITLLVEVDGAAWLGAVGLDAVGLEDLATGSRSLTIEIFVYVLGTELDVLEQTSLALDVDLTRYRHHLSDTGLKAFLPLAVPPGELRLRVLVQAGDVFGLRSLVLPAATPPGTRILTPVFQELDRPWLVAVPGGREIDLPPPFGLDAGSPLPATGPPARAGDALIAKSDPPLAASPAADAGKSTAGRRPTATRTRRRWARAAGDGYARALRRLAAGEHSAALATLRASEEQVAGALDADAGDLLAQAETRVLEPLPPSDWGCVLPVVLLHLDLSRAYRDSGRRILAHHATEMTIALAGAYARHLGTPQAAAEAARAVSSLGGYFQSTGALSQAVRLFTLALDLAGDDPAALLGLATIFEKRGRAELTVPVFARFVEARPEHAEGALRLALNRGRIGETATARDALDRLAVGRRTDWVHLLAHQELARLLIGDGQLPEAAGVLRRGLERWPDHPALAIQLAWVLDAQGEPGASSELLEALGSNAEAQPADERSRYNRWPEDVLSDSRRILAETARRRLGDLGRWLSNQGLADDPSSTTSTAEGD